MFNILLTALISGILIVLPSWSVMYNPNTTGRSKITRSGYAIFIGVVGLLVISIVQYYKQKEDEEEKDQKNKIVQSRRDSVLKRNFDSTLLEMKIKTDSNNLNTVAVISENLGKYGYKFDSANNQIAKMIKDSAKTKILVGTDPTVSLLKIENTGDTIKGIENNMQLKVSIVSADAGSCCFDMNLSAVGFNTSLNNGRMLGAYLWKEKMLEDLQRVPKDYLSGSYVFIERNKYNLIYFWLRGTYKNVDQTKTFTLSECYFFNALNNTSGILKGESMKTIKKVISEQETQK